jgi:hypothetical protein
MLLYEQLALAEKGRSSKKSISGLKYKQANKFIFQWWISNQENQINGTWEFGSPKLHKI